MKTTVLAVKEGIWVLDAVRRHCADGWALIAQFEFYDREVESTIVALTFEQEEPIASK